MGKRDQYQLVPEDDAQFCRFWASYPHRVAKKEARKAWQKLNPSPVLVDRIVATLEWQAVEWAKKADWYQPPYPASWLNAERWTDEAPQLSRAALSASVGDPVGEWLRSKKAVGA